MQLKKIAAATLCAVGLTVLTGCNAADEASKAPVAAKAAVPFDASKPVAVVNGIAIPQSQFNVLKQERSRSAG
jgi:peptidyl-prolyl cis-trans isomerase C